MQQSGHEGDLGRRGYALMPVVAASIGGLLFLGGLGRGMWGTSAEVHALLDALAQVEGRAVKERSIHEELIAKQKALTDRQASLDRDLQRADAAFKEAVRLLEEDKSKQREAMLPIDAEIEAIATAAQAKQRQLREIQENDLRKRRLSDWLVQNQRYLMTLYLPDGVVHSASLIHRHGTILMVTDAEGLPPAQVPFNASIMTSRGTQPIVITLTVHRMDPTGTIASLAVVGNGFETRGLNMQPVDVLQVGDPLYVIGTVQMGEFAVEHSVFDGSIAAPLRDEGGLPMYQIALPANQGSEGALVLNSRGEMLGMLVIRRRGTHAQTYLVPTTSLLTITDQL